MATRLLTRRTEISGLSDALKVYKKKTRTTSLGKYFESVVLPNHEFEEKTGKSVLRKVSLHTLKKNHFNELVGKFNVDSSVLSRLHVGQTVGEPDVYMMTLRLTPKQLKTAFQKAALKKMGLAEKDFKLVYNSGGIANVHTVFTENPKAAALMLAYLHSRFPA